MSGSVRDLQSKEELNGFTKEGKSVILHFWATWCEASKTMDQVFSHLSTDFPLTHFLRVEVEEQPEISKVYSVSAVPFFVFIKDGKTVDTLEGADASLLANKVVESFTEFQFHVTKKRMGARWKGKGSKAKALADPMSNIVSQLKSTLIESDSHGILSGSSLLVSTKTTFVELLNRSCFGRPIVTSQNDGQWFQLSLEEAFYLYYNLKCLKLVVEKEGLKTDNEIWNYMKSERQNFPILYKAYAYLRARNWVVRSGSQYGVDFVAYRHHPALVHSEYAVLVLSDENGDINGRLRVWSDYQCTLRLCGSVVKTLLVIYIDKHGAGDEFPTCLETYGVESRTITRWSPEQSRENKPELVCRGE